MKLAIRGASKVALGALFTGLALAGGGVFATEAPAPERTVVVLAGTLIDGLGGKPRSNVAVVVRGKRIVAIREQGSRDLPPDAERIDLGHATLLPGLIDAHTHVFLQGEIPAEGGYDIQLLKYPASFRAARAVVARSSALAGNGLVGSYQTFSAGTATTSFSG